MFRPSLAQTERSEELKTSMMSDTRDDEGLDEQACASFLARSALASFDTTTYAMAAIRMRWQYSLPCPDASTLIVQVIAFEFERFSLDAFSLCDIVCPDTIARSVRKRQAEFFFGRLAAREALRQQSLIPADSSLQIAIGGLREPLWPATAIGSISHTPHLAAAAVAPLGTWRGIGIDLEHVIDAGSREALLSTVVDRSELSLLQSICTSTDYPL
ncbi:4'-phosphopantetheinyl transferase family protein [Xanthomonas fragariae]|nr:hypothetical protein [Xanthomonas fragariae]